MTSRALKIAQVGLKGLPAKWGGMEKYVEQVGKRLARRGHAVTVFGSKWYCAGSGDHLGMKIRSIPTLHSQATDALSNALISTVLIMRGEYDIVHLHGYASYYFIPVLKMLGGKCVITAHGVESGWDNPKYGSFARSVVRNAYMTGLTKADAITTVAEHLRTRIGELAGVSAEVMPSGIDEASPGEPRIISDKYKLRGLDYVLFIGRIDPIKRADWLLDLPDIIGRGIRIVIAGGSQDLSTDLYYRDMIRRAAGNPAIIFTGPVHGAEKTELLSNCLCMIAPSRYEGLPITVLEAASYSRCCIASDIPAHREIIENGINGYIFPSDSKQAFLSLMAEIASMPVQRLLDMGSRARLMAAERYNWDGTTDKFERLYHDLVHGKAEER